MWPGKTYMMNSNALFNSHWNIWYGHSLSSQRKIFSSSPSSKCCIPTSPLPSQLMILLLVSQMQSIEDVFMFQFLHLCNSGCCLLWPLFMVDGQPMLLSQSGSPSWVPDLHFSLLFTEKLTLVTVSSCPISPTFPVYSSAGYFPSAYKHAVSFHILKKETLLTHTSSSCHFIFWNFSVKKLVEQVVFMLFSSFCSLLKLLWSVFCFQIKATETNSAKVTLMFSNCYVHWSILSPQLPGLLRSTWHDDQFFSLRYVLS